MKHIGAPARHFCCCCCCCCYGKWRTALQIEEKEERGRKRSPKTFGRNVAGEGLSDFSYSHESSCKLWMHVCNLVCAPGNPPKMSQWKNKVAVMHRVANWIKPYWLSLVQFAGSSRNNSEREWEMEGGREIRVIYCRSRSTLNVWE